MTEYFDPEDIIKPLGYPCPICNKTQHRWFLEDRIHKGMVNSNCMFVIFLGKQRQGKSWSSEIQGAEIFDEDHFDSTHTIWDFEQLKNFYRDHTRCLGIIEEIGVQYDNTMKWWSLASNVFKYISETMGYKENVIFMNCPDMKYVPPFLRPSIDYRIICKRYGKTVYNDIEKRNVKHHWLGWNTITSWSKISTRKITEADANRNARIRMILSEYQADKIQWNEKQLATDYGMKDKRIKNEFVNPDLKFQSIYKT